MKVISIGAHPDDVEMGMGGTIANHVNRGDEVIIVLTTLGGVSGDPKGRKEEAKKAAKILGVTKLQILDYSVLKLNKPVNELSKIIENILRKEKPDRVYTHSPTDFHQVHVGVSNSVIKAAKNIDQILFYETISSTTTEFRPDAYVDITKTISQKIKSLEAHRSQSHRTYIKPNVIRSLANTRYIWGKVGSNSSGYAEGFMIHKLII
jgi:LmbE family N-acetylglucosaminyl deacetylase